MQRNLPPIRYNCNNTTLRDFRTPISLTVTNSNVAGTWPGSGNIGSNPKFVNMEGGDFRLQRDSPCIDAGYNLSWMDEATDLDGNPRIDRITGKTDMGAFEYPYSGTTILIR